MRTAIDRACQWLADHDFGDVLSCEAVGGGSICQAWRVETDSGRRCFVKTHQSPPGELFSAEAAGLGELRRAAALRVPEVLHADTSFIALEFIPPGHKDTRFWRELGRGLAQLHRNRGPCFGFLMDNFCGETRQPNPRTEDGHAFFGEHRLAHQLRLARNAGRLESEDTRRVEGLIRRLPELVPEQPAVLIHGDLWSGNIVCSAEGEPVLVDPAAHWGWAEAEIAMTQLFGGFDKEFYAAYSQASQLERGWEERQDIYNLYHLLNHLNLFGTAYLPRVREVLTRYA